MKTQISLKKMFAAAMLAAGISNAALAQTCQAAFTYTVGSAGHVDITNNSTGGGTFTLYNWYFGDNTSSQQQSPASHNYMYNGNYVVSLSMSDSLNGGSCSSTYTAMVSITNAATCNLQVSYTYSLGANGQLVLTNTSTGVNPGMITQWNFGDGSVSTQSSPSYTYTYNGIYGLSLFITDTAGYCTGTQHDTIVITTAQDPPSCNASFTYTLGASGQVDFTGSDTGSIVNPTYSWSFGDGAGVSGMNATHTYQYNGTYNVYFYVVDSANGNFNCSYTQQITITNAANNPTCADSVFFNVVQDTSQAGVWNVYLYSNNYNSMMNATWSWGDGTSSSGLYPSHTYSSPGMYSICATVYFSCGDTVTYCQNDSVYRSAAQMISVHVINTQSGVHATALPASSFKVYPNPFANELNLDLSAYENKEVSCALYDVMGNVVMKENVQVTKGENAVKLNTSNLSNGVYFVRVTANDGSSSTLKVVK